MYLGVGIPRHCMVDCKREEYTDHPRLLPENTVGQSISCPTQPHADEYIVASEDQSTVHSSSGERQVLLVLPNDEAAAFRSTGR